MNEGEIRKYAKLMKELELTGLEIKAQDMEIRLERNMEPPAASTTTMEEAKTVDEGLHIVTSPMVGVFYQASREDTEPFVHVGDTIHKGDTLCIIEAMKLMNEVDAEVEGIVERVFAKNGETVGFGTQLFAIRRNNG